MNRRPMSAGLRTVDLGIEASAFLDAGNPKPLPRENAVGTLPPPSAVEAPSSPIPPKLRFGPTEHLQESALQGLVSLTVRVPRTVPQSLLLASVDRKLKRQRPFTQQEIVVEAITLWLKSHGHHS